MRVSQKEPYKQESASLTGNLAQERQQRPSECRREVQTVMARSRPTCKKPRLIIQRMLIVLILHVMIRLRQVVLDPKN